MKLASFFDLSGVLINGYMILEFPKYLEEINLFHAGVRKEIDRDMDDYVVGKKSYRDIALKLPSDYAKGLKGLNQKDVEVAAADFVENSRGHVYDYADEFVATMKSIGNVIAISGEPYEIVSYIAELLRFDYAFATKLEVRNGVYTGEVKLDMAIMESKETVMKEIIKGRKFDMKNSFAFGDTDQDLAMLAAVGNPIAVNPKGKLKEIAESNKWPTIWHDREPVEQLKDILEQKGYKV